MGLLAVLFVVVLSTPAAAETIQGRWKLTAAEDLRADGSVGRYPWGKHPVGSIVVEGGSCYLQIASSDVPSFAVDKAAVGEQMKASLLSTYIAYTGPCTINEAEGSVTLKVVAAWRPDYVGTEQKRFFRFENGKMFCGPVPAAPEPRLCLVVSRSSGRGRANRAPANTVPPATRIPALLRTGGQSFADKLPDAWFANS